jgi:hypothetical protein
MDFHPYNIIGTSKALRDVLEDRRAIVLITGDSGRWQGLIALARRRRDCEKLAAGSLLDIRDLIDAVTPVFNFELGERNYDRFFFLDCDHAVLVFD